MKIKDRIGQQLWQVRIALAFDLCDIIIIQEGFLTHRSCKFNGHRLSNVKSLNLRKGQVWTILCLDDREK